MTTSMQMIFIYLAHIWTNLIKTKTKVLFRNSWYVLNVWKLLTHDWHGLGELGCFRWIFFFSGYLNIKYTDCWKSKHFHSAHWSKNFGDVHRFLKIIVWVSDRSWSITSSPNWCLNDCDTIKDTSLIHSAWLLNSTEHAHCNGATCYMFFAWSGAGAQCQPSSDSSVD